MSPSKNHIFLCTFNAKMSAKVSHQNMALTGHTGMIVDNTLCLPGGQRIVSCSRHDPSLRVWDLESEIQAEKAWKDDESEGVLALALSPNGKEVARGSCNGSVRLWDIETGNVMKKWTGHTRWVQSVC
jgi:WD40 repeat protein